MKQHTGQLSTVAFFDPIDMVHDMVADGGMERNCIIKKPSGTFQVDETFAIER